MRGRAARSQQQKEVRTATRPRAPRARGRHHLNCHQVAAGALLPPAGSPAVCQAKMADSDSDEEIVDTAEFLSEDWVEQVRARAFRSLAAASTASLPALPPLLQRRRS